ncbi:Putative Levanase [Aspergillus calidoustus]|uniref:Putative Levanase n=1 Tax=Aspergillus calidoustus TaxID=454130 RepID=A0A0U5GSE9_ASPCI|nr:Putative Levanase [Aspergillus calidoustus]
MLAVLLQVAGFLACVNADNYQERYRPQYHFSPAKNWINDPNGLVFHQGKYHMFYQYNPTGDVWGNISWGHAVSTDLMHWDELPVALNAFNAPSGPLTELYYSGSAVTDDQRTSGWGRARKPPLVAVYTSHYTQDLTLPNNKTVRSGQESQSVAYSLDDGLTWIEHEDNPVILEPPAEYADQYQNFRDPFVFWYAPRKQWVMAVSLAFQHKVLFYTSSDLKDWSHVGEFGPVNAVGGQWECPSLFQLQVDGKSRHTKWVLMLGLNPGTVALPQGSGTQYVIGSFDGTTFIADADSIHSPQAPVDFTVFEDWSEPSFSASSWTPTGDFVGKGPSNGQVLTLWDGGDSIVGTLMSQNFNISSSYIQFQIGCCSNPHNVATYGTSLSSETTINLLVNGEVVRSTTGVSGGGMIWSSWNVAGLLGQAAQIELVDTSTGGYGHLNIGQIVFTDSPLPAQANWVDWGPDYYAAIPWNGLPTNERVAIGWMNDWAYGTDIPTSPWRSAMSIPRRLGLKTINGKVQLVQNPQPDLSSLESRKPLYQRKWGRMPSGNITLPVSAKTLDVELTFQAGKDTQEFGVNLRAGENGAGVRVGYDFAMGQMFVDRSSAGDSSFSALFPGVYYAPLSSNDLGQITLRILLDWSSIEVFGGKGESTITAQIFPNDSNLGVSLFSIGDTRRLNLF